MRSATSGLVDPGDGKGCPLSHFQRSHRVCSSGVHHCCQHCPLFFVGEAAKVLTTCNIPAKDPCGRVGWFLLFFVSEVPPAHSPHRVQDRPCPRFSTQVTSRRLSAFTGVLRWWLQVGFLTEFVDSDCWSTPSTLSWRTVSYENGCNLKRTFSSYPFLVTETAYPFLVEQTAMWWCLICRWFWSVTKARVGTKNQYPTRPQNVQELSFCLPGYQLV